MSISLHDNLLYDKRLIERNITKGAISRAEYEAHLAALPDSEAKGERVDFLGGEEPEAAESAE